jgi:hypothetical protein
MLHVGNTVFEYAHRTEFSLLIGEKEERFGRKNGSDVFLDRGRGK